MKNNNLTDIGRIKFNELIARKSLIDQNYSFTPKRLTDLNKVFSKLGSDQISFSYFAEKRNNNSILYPIFAAYRDGLLKIDGDYLVKTRSYPSQSEETDSQ
jgi:hypothetical protein